MAEINDHVLDGSKQEAEERLERILEEFDKAQYDNNKSSKRQCRRIYRKP